MIAILVLTLYLNQVHQNDHQKRKKKIFLNHKMSWVYLAFLNVTIIS